MYIGGVYEKRWSCKLMRKKSNKKRLSQKIFEGLENRLNENDLHQVSE